MLATSPEIYMRVLQVKSARDPETGNINWTKFFDSNSVYKLLYTLQIVEAVMEEGEGEGLERVDVIDDTAIKKNVPTAPPLPGAAVLPPGFTSTEAEPVIQEVESVDEPINTTSENALILKRSTSILDHREDDKLKSDWTAMFL